MTAAAAWNIRLDPVFMSYTLAISAGGIPNLSVRGATRQSDALMRVGQNGRKAPNHVCGKPGDLKPATILFVRAIIVHMAPDSPWPLRADLLSAKVLVWVARAGRDGDLTREAHYFFFDRYQRLAQFHKHRGRQAAYERLKAKADEHYFASGGTEPPYAAAMAMPRPRRWLITNAVAGSHSDDSDDAA